jgi:pimeloyl-ACP methyl ester carboxylesterase
MDSKPAETTLEHSGIAEKQITFGANGIKLNGKLFIPAAAGKHNRVPGAVLCHGFGNEQAAFEVSAREMAVEGVMTLTFDFRGHGESEGVLDGHIVEDVIDAWNYLHARPEVDRKRMGLIGHSMGAISSVIAAGKIRKAKAIVALACPGQIEHKVMTNPKHFAYKWFRYAIAAAMKLGARIENLKVRADMHGFLDSFPKMKVAEVLADLNDCSKLFVFCINDRVTPYNKFLYSYAMASEPKQFLLTRGHHGTPIESDALRSQWTRWAIGKLHGNKD